MRVTFIYPDFFQFKDGSFMPEGRIYLGLAYLSAVLKNEGHEVSLIHVVAPPEKEWLIETVKAERPDLIGFSSTTHMFRHVVRMAGWIDDELDLPVVCGGVHPSIAPEDVLTTRGIDMACLGEGEETILYLCDLMESGKDFSGVKGLWVKRDGGLRRNPARPLIEDLDQLPFPDRSIFKRELLCEDQIPRGTVMASRGCPFNCTYCSNHAQKSIYPNQDRYVRFRSPENVVSEIEELLRSDPGVKYIRFDDDIFTLDPEWLDELRAIYKKRVGMPFICNARVNFMSERVAGLLADMGCSVVCMGIESGNEWLRSKVLNRHMSNEQIVRAFRLCHEFGMKTVSTNMVGIPFETASMVFDTVRLNALCDPDTIQVSTFIPYPGTRLFELCKDNNLIEEEEVDSIFEGRSPVKTNDKGWESSAVKMNFHTLAHTLAHWNKAKPALFGRTAAWFVKKLLTEKSLPSGLRKTIFYALIGKLRGKYEPEWIKY